jgi:hypothetical protein
VKLLHRREVPPPVALAQLDKDERLVSFADTSDGAVVMATPLGIWWPDGGGHRRIGWQFVDKAVWRDASLTVTEAEVVDDLLLVDRPPVSVVLSKPRDLPPTIRRRVEANVVRSELLAVSGGSARFVARRVPGRDGVSWWVRLEAGTPDSPQMRSAVSARLAVLRSEWEDALP